MSKYYKNIFLCVIGLSVLLISCSEKTPATKESSIDSNLTFVRSSPYYPVPDRQYPYHSAAKKK